MVDFIFCSLAKLAVAVMCPILTAPENGTVQFSTRIGDTAEYSCDPGLVLVGEEVRSCQANGEWSGEDPVCEFQCPDLANPRNGTVMQSGNRPGSTACYTCASGFIPSSSACRDCLPNGVWSGADVICESESKYGQPIMPVLTFLTPQGEMFA